MRLIIKYNNFFFDSTVKPTNALIGEKEFVLGLGKRVNIDCSIDSLGLPTGELKWIKVNKIDTANSMVLANTTTQTTLVLHIEKLVREDSGSYQCVASNSIGTVKSDLVNITVQGMNLKNEVQHEVQHYVSIFSTRYGMPALYSFTI